MTVIAEAPTPFFLEGPAGALFAHYRPPRRSGSVQTGGEAVLIVPPFAEEMNRARPLLVEQARRLAERGLGVLILDLFGTGDSAGDFADATWATWRGDIAAGLAWLRAQGHGPCALIAVRLGACLALEVAREAETGLSRIVLWQPVLRGQVFLQQFLRIRVGSGIVNPGESQAETIKDLRLRLAGGETLEVAGYPLSPDLAAAVDGLELATLAEGLTLPIPRIHWLEVSAQNPPELTPAGQGAVAKLRAAGLSLDARAVPGEAFWAIEETTQAPALLAATTALWD